MSRRNAKDIALKELQIAIFNFDIKTLGRNIIEALKNERFFYLTHNLEHYIVSGRMTETGEYQFYVKYNGFKYDEQFKDLDFDDVDYVEARVTVADVMRYIGETRAFDYTDASLYMLTLEQKVIDLIKEVKRGN